jgi:phosphatidylinositol-3-phosphatase
LLVPSRPALPTPAAERPDDTRLLAEVNDTAAVVMDGAKRRLTGRAITILGVMALALVVAAGAMVLRARPADEGRVLTALVLPPAGSTLPVPPRKHVWLLVLENKDDGQIIGDPRAPYLNELIASGAVTEAHQGIAHPSQPNYLAMVSGSTYGVLDNRVHDLDGPTLFDQLEAAGKTWRVAAENLPEGCFTGKEASGGRDGPGTYARKHEPGINFRSIATDPARCAFIGDLTSFVPDAADFQLIIPNLCHDMHDCSIEEGDAWLQTFVPTIVDSHAFSDGLLVITFDESDGGDDDNDVATIVLGPGIKRGYVSDVPHSHYSLLRTIETALGLPCLAASCDANTLGELFDVPSASFDAEQ